MRRENEPVTADKMKQAKIFLTMDKGDL